MKRELLKNKLQWKKKENKRRRTLERLRRTGREIKKMP